MEYKPFGIYIKTHKPHYYLCKVLIASLRYYAPWVDITIIPDDNYDDDTIWGEKVLTSKEPFFHELKYFLGVFRVFFGPYDRFLFIDADQMAIRPLDSLINKIKQQEKPFFIADRNKGVVNILENGSEEDKLKMYNERLGDITLFEELDPKFNYKELFPVSGGNFATHKDFISVDSLKEIVDKAKQVHKNRGLPAINNRRIGILGRNQGLLNYIIFHQGVKPILVDNFYYWGGGTPSRFNEYLADNKDNIPYFIHWGGCPKPTFLRRNVPGADKWIHFYNEYYNNNGSVNMYYIETAKNIKFDLMKRMRKTRSKIKRKLLDYLK